MSVNKLLKRIVAPDLSEKELKKLKKVDDLAFHLHDYTHGINSDPLLHLAITISALIHDVGMFVESFLFYITFCFAVNLTQFLIFCLRYVL